MDKREKIKLLLKINNSTLDFENLGNDDLMPEALSEDPFMIQFRTFYIAEIKKQKDSLTEKQIDIYDAHLSEEAIDGALVYYQTKAGAENAVKSREINKELAMLSANVSNTIIEKFHLQTLKMDVTKSIEGLIHTTPNENTKTELEDFAKKHNLE